MRLYLRECRLNSTGYAPAAVLFVHAQVYIHRESEREKERSISDLKARECLGSVTCVQLAPVPRWA